MSALTRWQALLGLADSEAAQQLGLELREYCRQKATRPSRQTALLAILIALFKPDMAAIAATAATLDRRPGQPLCRAPG
jgi:hypothetical protein